MTQINPADLVVFQQLLRRAVQGDLTLGDIVGVIREFQSFIDVLLQDVYKRQAICSVTQNSVMPRACSSFR